MMECSKIKLGTTDYAYYELPNAGKPKMLLLHGMMVESHCFEHLIPFLREHYHLYLLDLKGHGKSSRGSSYDSDYTNDAIAADLHSFATQVIQSPFTLLGYSLGGQYTLKYAGTHPEMIQNVVLIDSAPALSLKGVFIILWHLITTPKAFRDKAHVLRFYSRNTPGFGEYMFEHCITQNADGRYSVLYDKKNLSPNTTAKGKVRTADLWESTKKITAPTLILRAEDSFVIDDKIEKTMRANITNHKVVLLKNMGHNLVFLNAETVANEIKGFVG